jgi:RNA 2',3'-cyclic 3'-phosphodiesterase
VALELPPAVREQLAAWARAVACAARAGRDERGSLRVLEASSLHLTLCFLGARPVGEIDALAEALVPGDIQPCELAVGAPLWLPSRRPQALAVEVHDRDGVLARAQQRISAALSGASGWLPERRRFRPHVTVARVRRGGARRRRGRSREPAEGRPRHEQPLPATPRLSFAAETIVLYRSWLAREGASYEALASCELAAS